jgi:thioredoxin-related protein
MDKIMKKYILLVVIFAFFTPLFSLEFYDISFNEAIKLAKKEKKLIFFMVEEKYCPWCRKMKATTLKDKDVMEILKTDYISIKMYKDDNNLKRRFKTRFVPTMFILDPNEETELSKLVGYISSESMYDILFVASRFGD